MNVLLTAVGRRDPFPRDQKTNLRQRDNPGAVLQGVAHVRPDAIYLLPTSEGKDDTLLEGEETRAELIAQGYRAIHLEPLPLTDPTDYAAVILEFRRVARQARETYGHPDTEWHVLFSSGAPQFRLAWSLLVLNGELPARCWEIRDPVYPGERVWEANIRFLDEPALRGRFETAWRGCDFYGAEETARSYAAQASDPERRERAAWVADLMRVYANWDAVRWRGALAQLRSHRGTKIGRRLRPLLGEHLEQQEQALQAIEALRDDSGHYQEGFWNLADLYHNARRRVKAGQYVDALARYRRIVEGLLYAVLRAHGCTIRRDDRGYAALAPAAEAALTRAPAELRVRRDPQDGRLVNLDLPTALFLVGELVGVDRSLTSRLQGYADHRNQTIAAHGMDPVDRQPAVTALDRAADLFAAALPGPILLREYPFSVAVIDAMTVPLLEAMTG